MFDKTYELSLTKNYVAHWGLAEAVRELIQNALDSNSPFVYQFSQDPHGKTELRLMSEFSSLSPKTLLLGSTTKTEDKDAIGSFGEGYKIAMLVLARLDYPMCILNEGVMWMPTFRYNKRFEEDMLVVEEIKSTTKNKGLTFVVGGLEQEDVTAIVASCLPMQDSIGHIKMTSKGDILLEQPGMLYVGGLYICKTDLKYGYNIKPEFLKLERDRQTVSGYELANITETMWYETKEFDHVAEMIEQEVPDVRYAHYGAPEMVKQACYNLFRKKNPGAIVAESHDELKQLVAQGMERVVVVNRSFAATVRTAPSYRAEPRIPLASPAQRLEGFFASYKFNMHERVRKPFAALIEESKGWKLK